METMHACGRTLLNPCRQGLRHVGFYNSSLQTRRVYTEQWKTQVAAFATQDWRKQWQQPPLSKRGALLPLPLHPSVYQSARILKLRGPACIDIQVRGHAASSRMTHYERLGVPDFADSKEIKKGAAPHAEAPLPTCARNPLVETCLLTSRVSRLCIDALSSSSLLSQHIFKGQRIATLTCTGIPKRKNLRS